MQDTFSKDAWLRLLGGGKMSELFVSDHQLGLNALQAARGRARVPPSRGG